MFEIKKKKKFHQFMSSKPGWNSTYMFPKADGISVFEAKNNKIDIINKTLGKKIVKSNLYEDMFTPSAGSLDLEKLIAGVKKKKPMPPLQPPS